jgi:hypothetical protein
VRKLRRRKYDFATLAQIARAIRERSPSTPILALTNLPADLYNFADKSVLGDPGTVLAAI